jgi:hypothetical protein
MENISLGLSILCSIGAATSLGLAIFFFAKNQQKQGSAFSALMFVCVVLAYVPQLDSIKGGFVDAKFNRTLNQANEIISRLSKIAVTNATIGYTTLAWGNRFAAPAAKTKQRIADEMDRQLAELKISADERHEMSKTFVTFIGVDLSSIFDTTIEYVLQEKQRKAYDLLQKEHTPENQSALDKLLKDAATWRGKANEPFQIDTFSMPEHLTIPKTLLDQRELLVVEKFKTELLDIFNECAKVGGYTKEASELSDNLLNNEVGTRQMAKDRFGPTFDN